MGILKVAGKVLLIPFVVYHFDHRCRSEAISTYGGNRKKDIGIGNYGFVHRNSDLLSRLATGSFFSLYGRCSDLYFICWRIYRYCNRLAQRKNMCIDFRLKKMMVVEIVLVSSDENRASPLGKGSIRKAQTEIYIILCCSSTLKSSYTQGSTMQGFQEQKFLH